MNEVGPLLALAFVLGLDSFRAGLALGVVETRSRRRMALAAAFGVADTVAAAVGYVVGRSAVEAIGAWAAPAVGAFVAVYAVTLLLAARRAEDRHAQPSGRMLVGLPFALGLDNLAAGAALGALATPPVVGVLVFGAVSGALAWTGLQGGSVLRRWAGDVGELIGGGALLAFACLLVVGVA